MTRYAVIVDPARLGYVASVVQGTIHAYYPSNDRQFRRPTAKWAKKAGERWIKRHERAERKARERELRARKVTGYK